MKKGLCILSAFLCILLTACGNERSIGLIGGADGPTAIVVDEKGDNAMYQQILVYCRSGRRSKIASKSLTEFGYTNVKEFGSASIVIEV